MRPLVPMSRDEITKTYPKRSRVVELVSAVIERMYDGRDLAVPMPCSRAEIAAVQVHEAQRGDEVKMDEQRRVVFFGVTLQPPEDGIARGLAAWAAKSPGHDGTKPC